MEREELEILRALWKNPLDIWELLIHYDNDIKGFYDTLESLKKHNLIDFEETLIKITPKGIDYLKESHAIPYIETKCPSCKGLLYDTTKFKEVLEKFSEIFASRPSETTEFDQGVVPEENSIRRLEFVYERGDLEGKEILFLGDDDLTSVAFALTNLPKRIVVLDVDKRIIDYINTVAKRHNLNLEAFLYNAKDRIKEDFVGKFDVFLTDPVETVKGMVLFLSRCAITLKGEKSSGYFGLSHLESSLKKWHEVEKNLLEMNFVITDALRDFNGYLLVGERILHEHYYVVEKSPVKVNPPDKLWYRSTFIRVELIDKPNPKFTEDLEWGRDLYFDDETYVVRP